MDFYVSPRSHFRCVNGTGAQVLYNGSIRTSWSYIRVLFENILDRFVLFHFLRDRCINIRNGLLCYSSASIYSDRELQEKINRMYTLEWSFLEVIFGPPKMPKPEAIFPLVVLGQLSWSCSKYFSRIITVLCVDEIYKLHSSTITPKVLKRMRNSIGCNSSSVS